MLLSQFLGRRIAYRAAIDGAERLDAVLRSIADPHALADKLAMALAGEIGQELQFRGRVRLQVGDLPPAGPHLHLDELAAQDTRLGGIVAWSGQWFRFQEPVAADQRQRERVLAVVVRELQVHPVARGSDLRALRIGYQARVS